MPVTPFVGNYAFSANVISAVDEAFIRICATLKLSERAGGLTEQVALKVLELARQGEHDPVRLTYCVLSDFDPDQCVRFSARAEPNVAQPDGSRISPRALSFFGARPEAPAALAGH
jgi:hypothetical protein